MTETFKKIIAFLSENNIEYKHRHHEPTPTSQDSARIRGESLSSGAKAIVYKIEKQFYLFVMAADQKMDTNKIKRYFKERGLKAKKTRFANVDELVDLTGLIPGSVPPFGRPILEFDLFVDPSLLENKKISFNAGSLEDSLTIKLSEYLLVAQPIVFDFT